MKHRSRARQPTCWTCRTAITVVAPREAVEHAHVDVRSAGREDSAASVREPAPPLRDARADVSGTRARGRGTRADERGLEAMDEERRLEQTHCGLCHEFQADYAFFSMATSLYTHHKIQSHIRREVHYA